MDDEWQQRLQRAVAETLRARQARRDERLEFQARRDYAKAKLHAEKLARGRASRRGRPGRDTEEKPSD